MSINVLLRCHPLVLANGPHYIEQMCKEYEQHVRRAEYRAMMQALELGIPTQQTELGLPQADDIKINDLPTLRPRRTERTRRQQVCGRNILIADVFFRMCPLRRRAAFPSFP